MTRVCLFDVNETLLDLQALDPIFERIFGDAGLRRAWFAQLLQSALVATVTDAYTDFGTIGGTALAMVAERHGTTITDADLQALRGGMQHLPAHPDALPSLQRLRAAGLRLAALTNSTAAVAELQLRHAGLAPYFEQILVADSVRRFKPAPEPYRMAADRLGVPLAGIRLVAAHAWDIAGALRAGCAAAFVARPGQVLDPLVPRPDVVGTDLRVVAELILEREGLSPAS